VSTMPTEDARVQFLATDQLDLLAAALAGDVWIPACDTETVYRAELESDGIPGDVRVISFATCDANGIEQAFVVDLRDTSAQALHEILASHRVCGWNANFDEYALARAGIRFDGWYDAMIADTVCRAGRVGVNWYRSLAVATKDYLGIELDGKGTTQTSYDATSDLTPEQIRYAGVDALVTRRVARAVWDKVAGLGLDQAVELETGARPFINAMQMAGVPFDLPAYLEADVAAKTTRIVELLAEIAQMTEVRTAPESVQASLFDAEEPEVDVAVTPNWNPNSKADLLVALNRWAADEVAAYTRRLYGAARPLQSTDSLRKNDLVQIGGPLVERILALKAATKDVSTYGADLAKYWRNGRFFSRYKQAGLVSTGRLASFNFNAQNMSKAMLPWMRAPEGRLFVYGDISQAELRLVAHFAGEHDMAAAFATGEDFHLATARVMFPDLDLDTLASSDPAKYKKCRTAAKAVNFGVPYGMSAGLLATNLTVAGVETDKAAAQAYLDAYFAARPNVGGWLQARDRTVDEIAASLPVMDFAASLELYRIRSTAEPRQRALRKKLGRPPSHQELAAELAAHGIDPAHQHLFDAEHLAWAFDFEGAVLLQADGSPFEFYSTTGSGRRRHFNVAVGDEAGDKFSGLLINTVLEMCSSRAASGQAFVAQFAAEHGLTLPGADRWRSDRLRARAETVKAFEGSAGRMLKLTMVEAAVARFGVAALDALFSRVAAGCVRGMRNAYRNHPIQGTVADVVEAAFAQVMTGLPPSATPILSVHDSLVVECEADDAVRVARLIHEAVISAMGRFCSSVVAKVDVDIRRSLADEDVIAEYDPDAVPELLAAG